MNYQITINAPEGKIPVYNESTQSIDFVDSDIRERVKTYEDALKVLGEERPSYVDDMPKHLAARIKCETILRALNGDHKFHLTKGSWYYPWLKIYLESSTPKEYKIESNPLFLYEGKKYRLRSRSSASGSGGVVCFDAGNDSGDSGASFGFACRSREIADYFSEQFKKLYFDAIYGGILEYKWLIKQKETKYEKV